MNVTRNMSVKNNEIYLKNITIRLDVQESINLLYHLKKLTKQDEFIKDLIVILNGQLKYGNQNE
jgi:hypothetical protein